MYLSQELEAKRFEILSLKAPSKSYDTFAFDEMTAEMGRQLISEGLMDPEDTQNYSQTNEEFVTFMETHPGCVAHGYIVSPERVDVRISIEGLAYESAPDKDLLIDFVQMFRDADEFSCDGRLYCWYD